MSSETDEASFSFSWLALKLLGRGLYSNPWSALSELVANGIDARARSVYVYIDARDKAAATVEVIDDGTGMSREDISMYVQVGHDKRKHARAAGVPLDGAPKGRKGIGKLAALFLSQHFYIATRHAEGLTLWELDARDESVKDDEHPRLRAVEATPPTANDDRWARMPTGTRITLQNVDLTGYGSQSMSALGSRLANQFLLPRNGNPEILMWVRMKNSDVHPAYARVAKSVAFGNLAEVAQFFPDSTTQPVELAGEAAAVEIPARGLQGDVYRHVPQWMPFQNDSQEDEALSSIAEYLDSQHHTFRGIRYTLTGWIGAHATINSEAARRNDSRFTKNKYYNPAQIRVYVRGKLASDRLLSQLGLTGTYVNYIEGEISFDLLDDDDLPDIATSNRQDFDETDGRVVLLRALVRPIVRSLIQRRSNLATQIGALVKQESARRSTESKNQFSRQLESDLRAHPEIPAATRNELHMVITNKIQGDVQPKQNYRVFISHSRADAPFVQFIDELLRSRGAVDDEIFFTSRTGSVAVTLDDRALSAAIKANITDSNTLIFYMTSKNFLASQYCLFEGGAGWATRSVSEYLKLNIDYASIPAFLTNGKAEVTLLASNGTICLSPEVYRYILLGVLNPMIAHLNQGRAISGAATIEPFEDRPFPSAVELSRTGSSLVDYFDPVFMEHWRVIVEGELPAYVARYLGN